MTFVTGLRDRPDRPASPRERGEALGGRADVPTKMVELRFLVKVSLPVEAGNAAAKKDGQGHSDHPRTAIAANALVRSGDTIIRLEDRGDCKPAERLREGLTMRGMVAVTIGFFRRRLRPLTSAVVGYFSGPNIPR